MEQRLLQMISMHLLVIDPYEPSRTGLAALLRLEGHQVSAVATLSAGFEEAQRDAHDAILTEVFTREALPVGELLARLREADPGAQIIVTSGVIGCEALFELARQPTNPAAEALACADHCLSKPVDAESLFALIEHR